jgi:phosphoribosyl-AMP cyclohydrolase
LIEVGKLNYNKDGLIPAIVQDDVSGDVLMLGYMNRESLSRTVSTGEVWFYSRSRQELWHKGATSGNKLSVRSIWVDCEDNSLLVKALPAGPTCHTGEKSCFFRELDKTDHASS